MNAVYPGFSNNSIQYKSIIENPIPNNRGFKIASLNINRLTAHIDELRILLHDQKIDVLAIQETKLDESNLDSEVYIPGYELVRRDRLSDHGGGICFYLEIIQNEVTRMNSRPDS